MLSSVEALSGGERDGARAGDVDGSARMGYKGIRAHRREGGFCT